ncbi:MAG: MBL fold metallo-hydrolase [Elusimicrobiaceae bacterium]|nr:MBL fold metallo-hydrolase [Elusimicrobiaceae bacterium]
MTIRVIQIETGRMANFSYLVCAENAGRAVLVDPSWDMAKLEKHAAREKVAIEACLLTHGHYDHSMQLAPLLEKLGIKAHIDERDIFMLEDLPQRLLAPLNSATKLELAGLTIEVVPTPGHSPGSVCYIMDGNIFTGDTLFTGACGRVDLPGSDPRAMTESLRRIATLDPALVMWPGHAYGTVNSITLGAETKTNPYIKFALRGITPAE